ncbi:TRAFAC class myosin-kinesin ATPase super [Branchiostoma belcheri]|nr:TRAFAC class myosin-kinesin ATPase super [Branchiostoma belcheri]
MAVVFDRPLNDHNELALCLKRRTLLGKWFVHGFLDKNKDTMRYDVVEMLIGSKCEEGYGPLWPRCCELYDRFLCRCTSFFLCNTILSRESASNPAACKQTCVALCRYFKTNNTTTPEEVINKEAIHNHFEKLYGRDKQATTTPNTDFHTDIENKLTELENDLASNNPLDNAIQEHEIRHAISRLKNEEDGERHKAVYLKAIATRTDEQHSHTTKCLASLEAHGDNRRLEEILPEELDGLLGSFFLGIKKDSELNKSISKKQHGLTLLNVVSHKVPTVSAKFQESLEELLEEISKVILPLKGDKPFLRLLQDGVARASIRAALMFDTSIVLEQLRNLGILDTIRIRKKGFPVRIPFKQFADRYKFMIGELSPDSDPRGVCIMILGKLGSHFADQFQLGQSKVFLREVVEHHLETERSRILNQAATQVQRVFRGHMAVQAFSRMKSAIVTIQAGIRMAKVRETFLELRRAVVLVQATWKMILQRRRYIKEAARCSIVQVPFTDTHPRYD